MLGGKINFRRVKVAIFLGIGTLFILIGIIVDLLSNRFYLDAMSTEGIISWTSAELHNQEDKNNQRIFVWYMVNGKELEAQLNYYDSSLQKGDKITVYYKKDNPYVIKAKNHIFLNGAAAIGIILIMVGIINGLYISWRKKECIRLKKRGILLYSKIMDVILDFQVGSMLGKYPYVVLCQYVDVKNNKIYKFKSDILWYNPKEYIKEDTVAVFVDPKNYNRYFVDIESVMAKAYSNKLP